MSKLYQQLCDRGTFRGQKNDCAVRAIAAVILNAQPIDPSRNSVVSHVIEAYDTAYDLLKAEGRKDNKGPTYDMIRAVLKKYNMTFVDITKSYPGYSTRTLGPMLPQDGKFLIAQSAHVSAVVNGVTHDYAKARKRIVERVWQLVASDDPLFQASEGTIRHERKRQIVINYERPTKAVWVICDLLYKDSDITAERIEMSKTSLSRKRWLGMFRAKVSAECVANGINPTTAAVQTGKWLKECL